ncbi:MULTISPECIES: hypothetical protein [unclassified Carboxylicivirga]|uniref:hypothetical protein n=1 Tax=Carboxylicivirga TaxID=1628153 RepID=UPI003D3574E8
MPVADDHFPEHKLKLRLDAVNAELIRLRESHKKQTIKIGSLRLWLAFTLVFSFTLFLFLLLQGFIRIPTTNNTSELIIQTDTVYIEKPINPDSLQKITYNTHPSALRKEGYDGVLFAIQIGAYKDLDLSEYKDNMLGLKQDDYENIHQFTLGEFVDYDEAVKFLSIVQQMGFKQAHIMAFKNGYRIRLENALELRRKNMTQASETGQITTTQY